MRKRIIIIVTLMLIMQLVACGKTKQTGTDQPVDAIKMADNLKSKITDRKSVV